MQDSGTPGPEFKTPAVKGAATHSDGLVRLCTRSVTLPWRVNLLKAETYSKMCAPSCHMTCPALLSVKHAVALKVDTPH